jgi:hypothetical protein
VSEPPSSPPQAATKIANTASKATRYLCLFNFPPHELPRCPAFRFGRSSRDDAEHLPMALGGSLHPNCSTLQQIWTDLWLAPRATPTGGRIDSCVYCVAPNKRASPDRQPNIGDVGSSARCCLRRGETTQPHRCPRAFEPLW